MHTGSCPPCGLSYTAPDGQKQICNVPAEQPGAHFGKHDRLPKSDYEITYDQFWKDLVENSDGSLNRDQIMRELYDYSQLMDNASQVYCELSGLSKPNTAPSVVISEARGRMGADIADDLLDWIDPGSVSCDIRGRIVEFAQNLDPNVKLPDNWQGYMKASDISSTEIIDAITVLQTGIGAQRQMIHERLSIYPPKVIDAKLRKMVLQGLIHGCRESHNCRGDYSLVDE